jgi:hypothetical protein
MKTYFLLISIFIFLFSGSCKTRVAEKIFRTDPFPLAVPEENSLMAQWEKKPVFETKSIDDMESTKKWTATGIGEMSYTTERAHDGNQSLRFKTSLRDEEHYRNNRTKWGSFGGSQGGNSAVLIKFDTPQDWSAFNRLSFWVYVHPTSMRTYCLHLNIFNDGTDYNATYPRKDHFIQDLKPGAWNHVMFEIPHLQRNRITQFELDETLTGHMPEDEGIVTFDIDQIELQKVEPDQFEGWNVTPGKIAFSQVGYRPGDIKTALAPADAGDGFQIIDKDNKTVYSGQSINEETINGRFLKLDFSAFNIPGTYRIRCGKTESRPFPIDDDIWLQPVFKALNFFFCERCGYDVPGIHRECHKDWQGFKGDEKKIINGGWHDAGDLSQGSWRTSMSVLAMLKNLDNILDRQDLAGLADRIRSEAKWGLEWMLKTRFGDGFHISFSVMRIYTDNKTGTIDDVVSPASNVPWENFLAAAVQSKAAMIFGKSDPDLATRCKIAAVEDWQAAVSSQTEWNKALYQEASWGATSSILLMKMTGDANYGAMARKFGNLLVKCQEQTFRDSIPVTGYFYEDTEHSGVIHNYHAAFEEAPIIALSELCRAFPDDEDLINWYSAAVLHSEYFMKRGSQIAAPYNLLPNSVWNKPEIMKITEDNVREDMLRQFNDGTRLSKDYVLRTFPVYHDNLFHGSTNIQMSDTWALAEASNLRCDSAGMQLVADQLRWIFGYNPFCQSLMYGEGYDFAPHFAYCLKDIVGSLPVGMDCMSGDMPHWCATNTATSKEIWVEPVNRFMGAVSVYTASSFKKDKTGSVKIKATSFQSDDGTISATFELSGKGTHSLSVIGFNATTDFTKTDVSLSENKKTLITVKLKVTNRMKPYVALLKTGEAEVSQCEITGAFISPSFTKNTK